MPSGRIKNPDPIPIISSLLGSTVRILKTEGSAFSHTSAVEYENILCMEKAAAEY